MNAWNTRTTEGLLYSGGWRPGGAGRQDVLSPIDGALVGVVGVADESDVQRAGEIAHRAQEAWARAPLSTRQGVLVRAAAALEDIRDRVEGFLVSEGGATPGKAHHEVEKTLSELRFSASLVTEPQGEVLPHEDPSVLSLARRVPVGIVGVIAPWNAPLMLAMRSIAPALALGNAVIVKPDLKTAISGGHAIAEVFERAGLPEGLLHILPGGPETGEALVASPWTNVISFTGSSRAGKRVGAVAGGLLKRVVLELGGNNAFLVLDDADIDRAVDLGRWGAFRHQGQICMATGRHLVHEKVADAYAERLSELTAEMSVGDPRTPGVSLGPLINTSQAEHVQSIVDASLADGATLMRGGSHAGAYFEPTVLQNVRPGNVAFESEIFGPVAPITTFGSDEEAVALANATSYGLSAAIHTRDLNRALRIASRLRTGMIHVNGQTINDTAHTPMGGMGSSGNGGRYGGHWNLDEFTYWQWVTVASTPSTP